jgi:hypothetical protein
MATTESLETVSRKRMIMPMMTTTMMTTTTTAMSKQARSANIQWHLSSPRFPARKTKVRVSIVTIYAN